MRSSAGVHVHGLSGHRSAPHHRDHRFGQVFTHSHIPVKGTPIARAPSPTPHMMPDIMDDTVPRFSSSHARSGSDGFGCLPKLHFSNFDGENPKPLDF